MHNIRKYKLGNPIKVSAPKPTTINVKPPGIPMSANPGVPKSKPKTSVTKSGGFNDFMSKSSVQSGLGTLNSLTSGLSASSTSPDQTAIREGIKSGLSMLGPVGAGVSAGLGVLDAIGSMTGLNLDDVNKESAKRLGVNTTGNDIINSLPGVSMLFGAFTGKTDQANKSHEISGLSSAFGGSVADINAAGDLSGKRILGGKRAANNAIQEANRRNYLLTEIASANKLRKNSSYGSDIANQSQFQYSGLNPNRTQIGKNGFKFQELEDVKQLLKSKKIESIVSQIEKFQEGGKLNIIVEGALHARKHNLDKVNPEIAEEVTEKGVPVIITDSDNSIEQVAEVEGGELVLTKEITNKLEELYKDGSEEAMINAGKLLTEEIIEYTEDLTESIIQNED